MEGLGNQAGTNAGERTRKVEMSRLPGCKKSAWQWIHEALDIAAGVKKRFLLLSTTSRSSSPGSTSVPYIVMGSLSLARS